MAIEITGNRTGATRHLWLFIIILILFVSGVSVYIYRLDRIASKRNTPQEFDVRKELYPLILHGDEARLELSGTWTLTEPSLKRVKELIGASNSTKSPLPTIDSKFMIMLMTGAKACYSGADNSYIGASDVRYFEKGKAPMSGELAHPNHGGPQGGMLAHMFTWRVVNQCPKSASTWSKIGTVRSWLIQDCELSPAFDATYIYIIVERDGQIFLRGTSPFTSEESVEFMEWTKVE